VTVERSLQMRKWGGELFLSPDAEDIEIEILLPRASAAIDLHTELTGARGMKVSASEVSLQLQHAAQRVTALGKPFLYLHSTSSNVDFVDGYVELANRGLFSSPGQTPLAERLERSVLNDQGDMRWRVRLRAIAPWSVQMLWIALAWFRRDGEDVPDAVADVFIHASGDSSVEDRTQRIIDLPRDEGFDTAAFDGWEAGTLELSLFKEPDAAALSEVYRVLELWTRVVTPGFPHYGGHMWGEGNPAALDAARTVVLELDAFDDCDPRALLTIGYWIQREGPRLGIEGYRFER
jgi:hypothetical protein